MSKTLSINTNNSTDTVIRIMNVLRRKGFCIKGIDMKESIEKYSNLFITIDAQNGFDVQQAVLHMKKLEDVYEVKVIN